MKISKIYANKNFKNIEFNENFNAVVAFIASNKKKDTHNLGKTSLIRVIDFLLLSKINKKQDKLFSNDIFTGQVFYGEFKLNNGKYLIIKRSVDAPTKISFKLNNSKLKGFITNIKWDVENLAFEKAKKQLNQYLSFDVLQKWNFRKSITYFLRTQQDYLDVFKLNKFKGKDKNWKPFVFELLGFNSDLIEEKLKIEEEIKELEKKLQILESEAQIDTSEKDKLEGLLEIKQSELLEVEKLIDKFNFYREDLETNKILVEQIDNKLQALNTDRYRISFEIDKINRSLENIIDDVDIDEINTLFSELNIYFPTELKKSYEELIKFQKTITLERKKYLSQNLQRLKDEYKEVDAKIKALEEEKSNLLSLLVQKDSYQKFKEYQRKLTQIKVEIERIKDKLRSIDKSLLLEKEIEKKRELLKQKIEKLKKEISERKHSNINKIFNSILKNILDTNALISLKLNKKGNIEFSADYQNPNDLIKTSESQGTTYKKLLCVAFDLALLIHYSNKSFYRFVYHDGVFEGLDDRIKVRYINFIKNICKKYNIQYILTLIDSDLPKGNQDIIAKEDICLKLNDKDDSGKLFLASF
ncbi:hypothetical protein JCM12298_10720 [Desulfothermus naphthae]